jgi:hypothetical protein
MGACQYRYNPSEQYQMQVPGGGTESHCGGRTYPIFDEPEFAPVWRQDPGAAAPHQVFVPTGRHLARAADDPYCPRHGGTEPPPEPQVSYAEVLAAQQHFQELHRKFAATLPAAIGEGLAATAAPAGEMKVVLDGQP